ncbi:MAG: hypothetical protein AB7I32_02510 [Gammaproteobacteria bacterium]
MNTVILDVNETPATEKAAYVDLPAIIAGALLAAAIAFLLTTFGSAVGLSMLSPWRGEGASGTVFIAAVGLWTIWVTVSSMMLGGYVAGRMRRRVADMADHEVEVRDGINGLVVWALAALFGAWLTASVAAGAARAGGAALKAGAEATAAVAAPAAAAAADRADGDTLQAATDRLLRSAQPASDEVIARTIAAAATGEPSPADREWLIGAVATRTGLTPEEATQRVDAAYAEARRLADEARAAADTARRVGVLVGFLGAASLLAGAVGAWWAATRGGRHRDQRTDFSRYVRFAD